MDEMIDQYALRRRLRRLVSELGEPTVRVLLKPGEGNHLKRWLHGSSIPSGPALQLSRYEQARHEQLPLPLAV